MNPGAAFDARTLENLKQVAKQDPQRGLRAAAQQMEGLFVQMMLKSMRAATFKDGLFNSQQSEMFTAMYDQQLSQDLAAQGQTGLADKLVQQLGGTPLNVAGSAPVALSTRQLPYERPLGRQQSPAVAAPAPVSASHAHTQGGGFISRLLAPAVDVSRRTGIPHQLILAQAALESGWGKRQILTEDGKPSYNLFGIKATGSWQGKTTEITTTEYENGVAKKVKAAFRVYDSYLDALTDYANLLSNNSRYAKVTTAKTAEEGAHALQEAGYATDPKYAKKLVGMIQQFKNLGEKVAKAYGNDIGDLF